MALATISPRAGALGSARAATCSHTIHARPAHVEDTQALRVAFISTMPPDRGNLAEYGAYLSHALADCPDIEHVDVLANIVDAAPPHETVNEKLTVHRVWRLGSAWSLLRLVWIARTLKPDVVHINAGIRTWGQGRVACMIGAMLSLLMHWAAPKVVTTLHTIGDTVRLDQMGDQIGWITRLGIRLATRLYLCSSLVTVTLRSMKRALESAFGATNVVQVSHGSYGARVDEPDIAGPVVFSFGFWGAFKDADLLVNAVEKLRNEGTPAKLVLGGGPHPYFPEIYSNLVARYRDKDFVTFTGYIPEEELDQHFRAAAVVVMPYRTNAGASGVLNLTRSYGRPVMITEEEGLMEQLRDEGGSALVFRCPEELLTGLRCILTNNDLQKCMGQANLDVARRVTIAKQAGLIAGYYRNNASETHCAEQATSTNEISTGSDGMKLLQYPPGGVA